MVSNDYMMGWTAGLTQTAMNHQKAALQEAGMGSQVPSPDQWGKSQPAAPPEKPNVFQTILGIGMELLPKFLEAKQAKKKEEEAAAKKKEEEAAKKKADAEAEAKAIAAEERAHQRALELAEVKGST